MNDRRDEDRLLEHDYDGIREYDNPMPRWWLLILWVSVLWSVVYALNIVPGVGSGPGRIQQYERSMAAAREKYGEPGAATGAVDDATVLAAASDPARVAAGGQLFTTYCAACHRADGGGIIGPNLTDDYWLHGNQPSAIHRTVSEGVLEKGMPAWNAVLNPDQVLEVVAYVMSIHGSHPADPKAPQGEQEEWKGPERDR
jgi:cytochrome c oxidase cbb3-type subunit 3